MKTVVKLMANNGSKHRVAALGWSLLLLLWGPITREARRDPLSTSRAHIDPRLPPRISRPATHPQGSLGSNGETTAVILTPRAKRPKTSEAATSRHIRPKPTVFITK